MHDIHPNDGSCCFTRYIVTVCLVKQSFKVYTGLPTGMMASANFWNTKDLNSMLQLGMLFTDRLGATRRIDEALDSSVKSNCEPVNKALMYVVRAILFLTLCSSTREIFIGFWWHWAELQLDTGKGKWILGPRFRERYIFNSTAYKLANTAHFCLIKRKQKNSILFPNIKR